jgi:hypothetical protein
MVTDNNQLVLRADRMLFSREVPPLTTAVCPDHTPPHDKQAALLAGTKVAPFHPPYLPNQPKRTQLVEWLSRSAHLCYPSFKSLDTCLEQRGDCQKTLKKGTDIDPS